MVVTGVCFDVSVAVFLRGYSWVMLAVMFECWRSYVFSRIKEATREEWERALGH